MNSQLIQVTIYLFDVEYIIMSRMKKTIMKYLKKITVIGCIVYCHTSDWHSSELLYMYSNMTSFVNNLSLLEIIPSLTGSQQR